MFKRICVFCGSSFGARGDYTCAAQDMGAALARDSITLVYGGGRVGLMGAVADSVLAKGGEVIGVIPSALATKELAHTGLTKMHVVESMHERKALMADLSDAFIALPGGYGTIEEFCEIITWAQLGIHRKPCGVLNVCGYFDPLLKLFDQGVAERFITPDHRAMVVEETDPGRMLTALRVMRMPETRKWIDTTENT